MYKKILNIIILLFLTACFNNNIINKGSYKIDISHQAEKYNERIKFLIIHYTATDEQESLRLLTKTDVSSHYLIPNNPTISYNKPIIYQLVNDNKRAWHAGISYWKDRKNINDISIGIEIVNLGYKEDIFGNKYWYPYHKKQIDALILLAKDIIKKYNIVPENILGHSDIAPLRKKDPGVLFPWEKLAKEGIGAWPDNATIKKYLNGRFWNEQVEVKVIQTYLSQYGYKIPQDGILDDDTRKVISAFQMHFRQKDISGNPDAETEAIVKALIEKYNIKE